MFLNRKSLLNNCLLLTFFLAACEKNPTPTESVTRRLASPGDIIVANSTSDAVYLLHPNGEFKRVIYNHVNAENAYGVNHYEDKILVTVDGVDRVEAFDIESGETQAIIQNPGLSGTLRGLTGLAGGDYLVIESNAVERFNSNFERITSNGWPKALMTTPNQINPLTNGGFVMCATGTDAVRLYDEDGVQTATVSSPAAGATNPYGCVELSDGRIAATWEGTQDRVVVYSADLSSVEAFFNDITIISNPRSIAQAANGNLLVADYDRDLIVELTTDGTYVRTIGDTVLNNPAMIAVIPDN